MTGVAEGNVLLVHGEADRLTAPAGVRGPLRVTAQLKFRRYRQDFLDRVVPDMERASGVQQPTITLSTATRDITVRDPSPVAITP